MADSAYARAGVDTSRADRAISGLVDVLRTIDTGKPSRVVLRSGHYATVIDLNGIGLALSTDGVGSKVIVAEQRGRYDTVGIDCVAVEDADPDVLRQIGVGLKEGAEQAGVEIPGGELAQLPELIRGHPSPRGFDLVGACFGTVELDAVVTGAAIRPGDA